MAVPPARGNIGNLSKLSDTFQDRFCRHFGVPADRFTEMMLRRTLYLHARVMRWLFSYDYLSPDRCFIASVGRLTRRRDFPSEVVEFREDARNLSFPRGKLRLRVSGDRMRALFREVWPETATEPAQESPATAVSRTGMAPASSRTTARR